MLGRKRALAAAAAVIATAGASAGAAHAAAGDLDPSFSGDGKVSLISAGPFVARAVAVQPDGRILVGGYSCDPGPSRNGLCQADGDSSFRIARFTPDGGLDPEWGDGGLVTTSVGAGRSQIFDLLLQAGGAVVAGGVARDSDGRDGFALARYDAHGAIDRRFGDGGVSVTTVGGGFAAIADLAPAPDGGFVAGGQATDGDGRRRVALARYGADGQLDGGFGPFGTAITGSFAYSYGLGVWVAPGGAVMAAGISGASAEDAASYRTAITRQTAAGDPDGGFNGSGSIEYAPGSSSSFANAMTGLPDGRWLTAGAATDAEGRQVMALLRGTPDGRLDGGWDGDGVALVRTLAGAVANEVLRLDDGRVIAVGQAATGTGDYVFALARLDDAGRLDPAFGGGAVTTSWTRFPVARATAGALDASGRVVAAGIGCLDGSGAQCERGTAHLTLARYQADPAPAETPAPAAPAPADTRAPRARVTGLPTRVRRTTFAREGVRLRVRPDEEAAVAVTIRHGKALLARRVLPLAQGMRSLRLRPLRRRLPRARRFTVRVEIRSTDRAGNTGLVPRRVSVR